MWFEAGTEVGACGLCVCVSVCVCVRVHIKGEAAARATVSGQLFVEGGSARCKHSTSSNPWQHPPHDTVDTRQFNQPEESI